MLEYLCIRLEQADTDTSTLVDWLLLDADGALRQHGRCAIDALSSEIEETTAQRKVIAIVPSDAALLTRIEIPAQQQRHLKQVLPFIVEEHVIDPIEQMHFAATGLGVGGVITVAGLRRDLMHRWLDLLEGEGLQPDYMFLDVLCLPAVEHHWQLLFHGRRVLFRHGQYEGMVADENTIKTVLRLAIGELENAGGEEQQPPPVVALARSAFTSDADGGDDDGATERFDSVSFRDDIGDFIRSENLDTESVDYRESIGEILSVNAIRGIYSNINLLQGDFRANSANAENVQILKKAGVAIAACLALFMLFSFVGGAYLNYQADRYFDKSVALYKDIFPKQRRIIDPVKQMKSKLNGESPGTTSEFLPLLDAASSTLADLDQAGNATLTQLRYDAQRGDIVMDLRVGSIDVLEAYRDQLASEGLEVDIMSANQSDNVVNGRLQLGRI